MPKTPNNMNQEDEIVFEEENNSSESGFKGKSEKKLRDELKACQNEKQEYLEGWQRAKADLINFKKEAEETRIKFSKFATEDLITQLIPVLDSFDMAFASADGNADSQNWLKGFEHIQAQLLSILEANGIEQINPEGQGFDPEHHESLETVKVEEKAHDNIIVEVVQKGYMLNGKSLRAAKVKVGAFNK